MKMIKMWVEAVDDSGKFAGFRLVNPDHIISVSQNNDNSSYKFILSNGDYYDGVTAFKEHDIIGGTSDGLNPKEYLK